MRQAFTGYFAGLRGLDLQGGTFPYVLTTARPVALSISAPAQHAHSEPSAFLQSHGTSASEDQCCLRCQKSSATLLFKNRPRSLPCRQNGSLAQTAANPPLNSQSSCAFWLVLPTLLSLHCCCRMTLTGFCKHHATCTTDEREAACGNDDDDDDY